MERIVHLWFSIASRWLVVRWFGMEVIVSNVNIYWNNKNSLNSYANTFVFAHFIARFIENDRKFNKSLNPRIRWIAMTEANSAESTLGSQINSHFLAVGEATMARLARWQHTDYRQARRSDRQRLRTSTSGQRKSLQSKREPFDFLSFSTARQHANYSDRLCFQSNVIVCIRTAPKGKRATRNSISARFFRYEFVFASTVKLSRRHEDACAIAFHRTTYLMFR